MLDPVTEENSNHPELLDPIVGTQNQYSIAHYESILGQINKPPSEFTGAIDGNPRSRHSFPDSEEEQLALIGETGGADRSQQEEVLGEEFSMQMQRTLGLRSTAIPPIPLLPRTLSDILDELLTDERSAYTVWIPIESETIDETAVGQFREQTPGKIMRFTIEHNGTFTPFNLIPDASQEGFGWYQMQTTSGEMWGGLLEAEESQRLEELLNSDGDSKMLFSVPDRVKRASNLLGARLSPSNPSPTPNGWLTTMCERSEEKSEFLAPRYNATFVHKDSDVVIELHPQDAADPISDGELTDESVSVAADEEANIEQGGAYSWEIHFAPESVIEEVKGEFEEYLDGEEFNRVLRKVDALIK